MRIPQRTQENLASGDIDAVEAEWLAAVDGEIAVETFLAITKGLVRLDEGERIGTLLELLDDQLQMRGLWADRLDLIRGAGSRYLRSGQVYETVLDTLHELYRDRESDLNELLHELGLDRGRQETVKLWDKVDRLRNLLAFQRGDIVEMTGRGVGRIAEVNMPLQTFKVDLETAKGVAVGFRAAGKMLTLLPPEHVLRRKLEEPQELAAMKPPRLLELTLKSYDRPLTGAEVRAIVVGIIPARRWSSWWTSARKQAQVLSSGGSRQTYRWVEATDAESSLWQEFEQATPRARIGLLRRAANQSQELRDRMAAFLDDLGQGLARGQPALAFEIRCALERFGAEPTWPAEELLASMKDPLNFFASIDPRGPREQAYRLLPACRSDWREVLERRFLLETDTKAIGTIAELIDEELLRRCAARAQVQPHRTPAAFTWLAEGAATDPALRDGRQNRLLNLLIQALRHEAFAPFRLRLKALFDSGGTIPKLLPELTLDEARQAEASIRHAALEDYRREPLLAALHLKFPDLLADQDTDDDLYALPASIAAKRDRLRELVEEELPANRKAIEEARALGDLRENFEYKSARQRHEYLTSLATELQQDLQRSTPIDLGAAACDKLRIGNRAIFESVSGEQRTLAILGPWESAPERGIISYESDLALRLLGSEPGAKVELDGQTFTLQAIETLQAGSLASK
jgi:transcription elongation GreA/GreB family factor